MAYVYSGVTQEIVRHINPGLPRRNYTQTDHPCLCSYQTIDPALVAPSVSPQCTCHEILTMERYDDHGSLLFRIRPLCIHPGLYSLRMIVGSAVSPSTPRNKMLQPAI